MISRDSIKDKMMCFTVCLLFYVLISLFMSPYFRNFLIQARKTLYL